MNFKRLKDYYKESDPELFKDLDNNILDYQFAFETLLILTKDGKLFTCGTCTTDTWNVVGLGVGISAEKPTQILGKNNEINGVKAICGSYNERFLVTNSGELYAWGSGSIGVSASDYFPAKVTNVNLKADSEIIIKGRRDYGATILENYEEEGVKKQKIWICNSSSKMTEWNYGIDLSKSGWMEIDYSEIFGEEKVKKFISSCGCLMLITENGNLYVTGYEKSIGINSTSDGYILSLRKIELPNPIEGGCTGYSESGNIGVFFVCYDSVGNVYGTGFNGNGVLGRWKGGTRGEQNSRYKTAFEWVECPELEI